MKIRRGGYVFITCVGDHPSRHVHVYLDGRFVVKWDLDNDTAMRGAQLPGLTKLIRRLEGEGLL